MADGLHSALKEAERVVKKQKLCASKTLAGVDALLASAQRARAACISGGAGASSSSSPATCLAELHRQLLSADVASQAAAHTKELHSSVTKLGKALDKAFEADVCKSTRDLQFDRATLARVVAGHLYQVGSFEVGDTFSEEAGVERASELKAPFVEMHGVLQQIRRRNLAPAHAWIDAHRSQLEAAGVSDSFEFGAHRLQYLHLLATQGQAQALQYARSHFSRFQRGQMPEIQRLMGALAFARRPAGQQPPPYAALSAPERWDEFAREFARHCCALVGLPAESPLLVSVAAGAAALPSLIKLATALSGVHDIKTCDQLPVELELGREFVFHSVFACPVSREQAGPDNPPTMLPCGHVLCRQSVVKIAKGASRAFKCPYCPVEATLAACKQLTFPDAD